MSRAVFDALDRNWYAFVDRPEATAALDGWSATPELAAGSLEDLVSAIWAADKDDADRGCAALAARAPADETAARVLLQVLRPGLRNLGRRLALGASFNDVDHELLALAWERIRTYRVDRRPRSVAANILLDIRKAYVRAVLEPDRGRLEHLPDRLWPTSPSAEHEALDSIGPSLQRAHAHLVDGVNRRTITAASAALIWRTRVQQDDDSTSPPSWASKYARCNGAASAPSGNSQPPADPPGTSETDSRTYRWVAAAPATRRGGTVTVRRPSRPPPVHSRTTLASRSPS